MEETHDGVPQAAVGEALLVSTAWALDEHTDNLFHPIALASSHVVVDDTEDVAKEVTRMSRRDRCADWVLWLALRAPAPPTGHVAAQHGQSDLRDLDVVGLASSGTSACQLLHFPQRLFQRGQQGTHALHLIWKPETPQRALSRKAESLQSQRDRLAGWLLIQVVYVKVALTQEVHAIVLVAKMLKEGREGGKENGGREAENLGHSSSRLIPTLRSVAAASKNECSDAWIDSGAEFINALAPKEENRAVHSEILCLTRAASLQKRLEVRRKEKRDCVLGRKVLLTHWSHDKVTLLMSIGLGLKVDAPSKDS
ncbi:hypothetical protein EYF80_020158 [Liparis tanakae]|uniref:Uncharacterized protein n=1 Tax=Liparis tanakae TaxID=230148 RepID=A0A4Z2HVH2_9TELE|nr:hypothetical protein EYF80_020158 [Liparis tanakae]